MIQVYVQYARNGDQYRRGRSESVERFKLTLDTFTIASMLSWFSETPSPASPLKLDLKIDDKRAFKSLERFTGTLTIKALVDTNFDKLDIKLTGTSRTYGRRVVPQAPSARTVTTAHRFLELTQPDVLLDFPEPSFFAAGRIYKLQFEFAVPDRMLPATCRHAVASPCVHTLHTLMPPSFGDHELGDVTDYAPRHASIKYRVVAEIRHISDAGEHGVIASASEPIRFMPKERVEALCMRDWDPARMSQAEMSLSRLWTKPSGKLAVASIQSTPFVSKDFHSSIWRSELSGCVKINLNFYPAHNEAKPPRQIDFSALLRTNTFSAVSPLTQLPSDDPWYGPEMDKHTAPSIILSPQVMENIEWVQGPPETTRPDEDIAFYEAPPAYAMPQNNDSTLCYSAQVTASLGAASAFLIVPTFHSCLITRAYDLDLRLSLPGSAIGLGPAMRIKLPVQVVPEAAALRRDSAMDQEEALGSVLGCDPTCEDLGMTTHQGPPPGYQYSSQ